MKGWVPLSFMDNLSAGIENLGTQGAGVAWGLAGLDWDTVEDRDAALVSLAALTADDGKAGD